MVKMNNTFEEHKIHCLEIFQKNVGLNLVSEINLANFFVFKEKLSNESTHTVQE